MGHVNFEAIADQLLSRAAQLLHAWLPDGHFEGDEFVALNPTRGDHSVGSFKVNSRTGAWADFSSGDEGGDLISLFAYLHGLSQVQAARELIESLGLNGAAKASAHRNGNGRLPETLTRYEIRDEHNTLVAVHGRKDYLDAENNPRKDMWWERPDGAKGLGGIKVCDLPLYGTERIPVYLDRGVDMIVVVEGERAADSLMQRDIAVAGTVTGAGKIPGDGSLKPLLQFKSIALWPDNDTKGRTHMDVIARALIWRLSHDDVRIVEWPEAPATGDAADFQGGPNEVEQLIAAAVTFEDSSDSQSDNIFLRKDAPEPQQETRPADAPVKEILAENEGQIDKFSEDRMARDFVQLHCHEVRFVGDANEWFIWNGSRWGSDRRRQVFDWARKVCCEIGALALSKVTTVKFARAITSAKTRYSVASLASDRQSISRLLDEFDTEELVLGGATRSTNVKDEGE
jgi:hypothetical protein